MISFCILLLVQVSLGTCFLLPQQASGCNIDITALNPEPIVISGSTYEFLYPEPDEDTVSLRNGESIIISCTGGQLTLGSATVSTAVTATCEFGTTFRYNGQTFNFDQLKCSRNPYHTARYTGNSCEANGKEIEIGFVVTSAIFARLILICFDEQNLNPLYSFFDLPKSIGHHETGVSRPSFIEDSFYNLGVKVNDLYVRNGQKTTINGLLGLSANSTKYIADSSDYYLARGHLTAKADFIYAPQQQATFHYVNAAPQWQTFNGDNWNIAEGNVRDYADANRLDLKVYTGTYGVATLAHEQTGKDISLYLYADSNGNRGIPVPELFWKVVYDPQSKRGVVLLGLNNPYQASLGKSLICTDISSSIKWLSWKPTNQKSGFSYACTVNDFRRTVSYFPQFDVQGLLL